MSSFKEARRDLRGVTSRAEKRLLLWLAPRLPEWVRPDHLTALGLLAMLGAGLAYAASAGSPLWLHAVNACLLINWFGDSLDGTLARHRRKLRPRYGFYVDHLVDAFGAAFLLGGLALSGYMSERLALVLLAAYYLMAVNVYLATYTRGTFQMSYGAVGGTELRILLALANLAVMAAPRVGFLGVDRLLFDLLGFLGILGLLVAVVGSSARNTRALYELERV